MSDQSSRQQAVNTAIKLGIQRYDEKKVPHCGVGINLKTDVILPLKNAACLTAKSE